jgi:hypothetical protein
MLMFFIQSAKKGVPTTYIADAAARRCTATYSFDADLKTFIVAVQIYKGHTAAEFRCPLHAIKDVYNLQDEGRAEMFPKDVVNRLASHEHDLLLRISYTDDQSQTRSFCLLEVSRKARSILIECLNILRMKAAKELCDELQRNLKLLSQ